MKAQESDLWLVSTSSRTNISWKTSFVSRYSIPPVPSCSTLYCCGGTFPPCLSNRGHGENEFISPSSRGEKNTFQPSIQIIGAGLWPRTQFTVWSRRRAGFGGELNTKRRPAPLVTGRSFSIMCAWLQTWGFLCNHQPRECGMPYRSFIKALNWIQIEYKFLQSSWIAGISSVNSHRSISKT